MNWLLAIGLGMLAFLVGQIVLSTTNIETKKDEANPVVSLWLGIGVMLIVLGVTA